MRPRRGFALLASLWLVVGLSVASLNVALLARARRLAAANGLEGDQARAAALAGIEHARGRLVRAAQLARGDAPRDPWRRIGGTIDGNLGTGNYEVRVRDDAALLDVNRASDGMLARLLTACGADLAIARRAAERIADWRDEDQFRRPQGAERDDYLAAGAKALPGDAAIRSVAELDAVLGLPAAAWACASSHLAVDGAGLVNPNTASPEVLQALPGVSEAAAMAIVTARAAGVQLRNLAELLAVVPPPHRAVIARNARALDKILTYETNVVRVVSVAVVAGSPTRATAEALLRRVGTAAHVEWRIVQ
jgi:general secretion pathway protein K